MTKQPLVLRRMRVLLVEDVPDIRDALTTLLRAEGAEVMATGSGREAVDLLGQHQFDVVLSDLGLPDIPGDVLIRQVRAGSTGRARVVVITGYGEPYLTRARQAGADAVFVKPLDWTGILAYLRRPDLAASA